MKTSRYVIAFLAVATLAACSDDPKPNANNIISEPPVDGGSMVSDAGGDFGTTDGGGEITPDAGVAPDATTGTDAASEPDAACEPETDAEMCARYVFECGPLQNLDNCGEMRTIDSCGDEASVCQADDSCGGSGIPGQCGCTIATCEGLGVLCGEVDDTCGGTLSCDLFCVDEITAGGAHGCAIGSGSIKCWGKGGDGQLGTGTTSQQKNPIDVVGLTSTVAHAAAGVHHTCAIDSAGRVLCWGDNARGQLGVGTTVDTKQPGTPAIFAGADQVVAGEFHVCARSADKLECWGSNDYGQIGNASFNIGANVGVPTLPDGMDVGVNYVASGRNHVCALQDEGGLTNVLKCWGRNRYGQVGTMEPNNTDSSETFPGFTYVPADDWDLQTLVAAPVAIEDPENPGQPWSNIKTVAAGGTHTCVIDGQDRLWCWGIMPGFDPPTSCPKFDGNKSPRWCSVFPRNTGIFVGSESATRAVQAYEAYWVANDPVQVELNGKIPTSLAAGQDHHCMIVSNPDPGQSNILCFGRSDYGQVGDGTNNNWPSPRTVFLDVNGNPVVANQIEAGEKHTCALVNDSNVKCWGSNADGQIGNSALMRDESYRPFDVRLAP